MFTFFVVINYSTYVNLNSIRRTLLYKYIDVFFPSRILSCMSICLHYWAKKSHPIPAINPMFTLGSRMFFKVRHLGKKKDEFEANDRLFFRRSPSYNVPILYDFFPLSSPLHRFGHTTIPPGIYRRDGKCNFRKGPHGEMAMRLCSTWWDSQVNPIHPSSLPGFRDLVRFRDLMNGGRSKNIFFELFQISM